MEGWSGQDLSLRITDGVADRDGADQLRNVQILRFADGDVVLDAEGNQPNTDGYYLGESIEGSLPVTDNYNETDVDYFQWAIRYDDAITTETAIRISFEGLIAESAEYWNSYVNFQFYAQGSNDRLRFNDLNNDNTYNQFGANFNQSRLGWLARSHLILVRRLCSCAATGYPVRWPRSDQRRG